MIKLYKYLSTKSFKTSSSSLILALRVSASLCTSLFCTVILGAECALVEGCAKFTFRAVSFLLDLVCWSFLSLMESLSVLLW